MKVIELLTKIANGEEVPLIKYRDKILHWNKEKDRFENKDGMNTLYEMDFSELNDEIEIMEEDKKIKKINWKSCADNFKDVNSNIDDLSNKINEIIEVLNERDIQRH